MSSSSSAILGRRAFPLIWSVVIVIEYATHPDIALMAVKAENGNSSIWKIRENGNHEGNAVIEQTHAALQQRFAVSGQRKEKSRTGSSVSGTRDRVVVEADTEGQGQTRVDSPLVARKPSSLILIDME